MKTKGLLLMVLSLFLTGQTYAQKVLSEVETAWVNEAKSQLNKALSDVDMSDETRVATIKRSATTLKQYGQPSAWPSGKIPLQTFMDQQFNQCKDEIATMDGFVLNLENQSLKQKMKLINSIQLEVVEEQVSMLIPGNNAVQLSFDVVGTVFGVNIAEGFNGGMRGDVKELSDRFKQLAETNQLSGHFKTLVESHQGSLRMISAERDALKTKVPRWKQLYNNAEASTITFKGYEGALPYGTEPSTQSETTTAAPTVYPNTIYGEWKFGYERTGYFHWTFYQNGEYIFHDKMNQGSPEKGTFTVRGNVLSITGPAKKCQTQGSGDQINKLVGNFYFVIEGNKLRFTKIDDECIERKLTLWHVWTR